MGSDLQEFAERYRALSEPDLLLLAHRYDDLQEPAQVALRAEFSRRSLDPPLLDDPAELATERRLITIRRFRDLSEAIVVRGFLEANGIPVYLQDENLVRLDWQVSNFIGGLRLQVESADEAYRRRPAGAARARADSVQRRAGTARPV